MRRDVPVGRALVAAGAALLATAAAVGLDSATGLGTFVAAISTTADVRSAAMGVAATAGGAACSAGARDPSPVSCPGSLEPEVDLGYTGNPATQGTGTITDTGSPGASLRTERARLASCGVVAAANARNPANVAFPRYDVQFDPADGPLPGSGSFDLNARLSRGEVDSFIAEPDIVATRAGQRTGVAVWFRTASTAGGPLVDFGPAPYAVYNESTDWALSLAADGRVRFDYRSDAAALGPSPTGGRYDDGRWHVAWLVFQSSADGSSVQVFVSVDGVAQLAAPLAVAALPNGTGYLHVGSTWSAAAGTPANLAGAVSDVALFADAAPSTDPASASTQAQYASWAADATDLWPLDDTGTTTYPGALPSTDGPACGAVLLSWDITDHVDCDAACPPAAPVSSFVAGFAVVPPAPGQTQTWQLVGHRNPGYVSPSSAFFSGLIMYAPIVVQFQGPGGWSLTLSWSSSAVTFEM